VLLAKHGLLVLRDPIQFILRIFGLHFIAVFFGMLYWESRSQVQERVFQRVFYSWWVTQVPPSLGILPLVVQWFEAINLKREVADGNYNITTYMLAQLIITIPMLFVMAASNLWPAFLMGNFPWEAYGQSVVIVTCMLLTFEFNAHFSTLDPHPAIACANFLNFWFTMLLFNGWMLNETNIPWPFRVTTYITPLRYSAEAFIYRLFADNPKDYAGALPCVGTFNLSGVVQNCTRTFYCPTARPNECFGRTGFEILTSFSVQYDTIKVSDRFGMCIGIMLGLGGLFKIIYFFKFTSDTKPALPKADAPTFPPLDHKAKPTN